MFVSSEWEPDVPKDKVVFGKKASKRKLSKSLITSTKAVVPIENAKKIVTTNGFLAKTAKRKNDKPTISPAELFSPQNEISSEQTTKTKKRKKGNKNTNPPGMFVRNPSATIPDSSQILINSETQQSEFKSNGISKSRKSSDNTVSVTKSKKRKHDAPNNTGLKTKKLPEETKIKHNQTLDKPDESFKLDHRQQDTPIKSEGKGDLPYKVTGSKTKAQIMKSKNRLKAVLNMGLERNSVTAGGNKLRERMLEKLKSAQFRYLNEKLYTSSGSEAQQLFQADPSAFQTYHEGYQLQLKKWPLNPLDVIVKSILKMPKNIKIADMGCGEASLSKRVPQSVRSFDLVARAPQVEACDMARTPLLAGSVDVAVYCLALMGTDLTQYLVEANRVLKQGVGPVTKVVCIDDCNGPLEGAPLINGLLLIAEVESRFDDADAFAQAVSKLGFKLLKLDKSHQVFYFMEFRKAQAPAKKAKWPQLTLKPCLYKRR